MRFCLLFISLAAAALGQTWIGDDRAQIGSTRDPSVSAEYADTLRTS